MLVRRLRKSFCNEVKARVVEFKEPLTAAAIFRIKRMKRNKIKKPLKNLL